jgi:hypothetical protein
MNDKNCPCVRNYTHRLVKAELGINPLAIIRPIREQVYLWYGVETIDELMQYHWDAEVCLNKLYSVLWEPIYAHAEKIGYRANPECGFCLGTGTISEETMQDEF